jgi:aspartate/glutamate racemase
MVNSDEKRELVKRLVRERVVERAGVQNIVYGCEEICVSNVEDGPIRFNLPRLKKSYVVMSGRVYEREYMDDGEIRIG